MHVTADTSDLSALVRAFPYQGSRMLSRIAKRGRLALRDEARKAIRLTRDVDRRGRYTITGKVLGKINNPIGIIWQAYPLHLFERGRLLRSGRRERGKKVFPKFRSRVNSSLPGWSDEARRLAFESLG